MYYLKSYISFNEAYVNHSPGDILKNKNLMEEQKPWDDLWSYLTETFKVLGIDFRSHTDSSISSGGDTVEYTVFKFTVDFNIIPFSILSIMSQNIITPELKKLGEALIQIIPTFKNSIPAEVSSISMIISDTTKKIKSNKFRINPKTPEEAWTLISNKIINIFTPFDNIVRVGTKGAPSYREPLNVKDIIISYISSNKFRYPITIPTETLKRVNWVIENSPNGMILFNNVKIHNPILFDNLKQISGDKADVAADMGGLGFE